MIRLEWKPGVPDARDFTDFVQRAFSSRRKKLINNLLTLLPHRTRENVAQTLQSAGLPVDARPETLTVEQFHRVYNQLR